jgi:imidazole glycerol phosphate synthase glutamine amidotransferase subunit
MIGIVDYGIGNLRSVQKAVQHVGGEAVFVRTPEEIGQVDALILPGVGNFGDCIRSLAKSGMWKDVLTWANSEKPFFGICVGYQMLFESSEEAPGEKGLGVFAGQVRKFSEGHGLKIPQIGWNTVTVRQSDAPLLSGISNGHSVSPREKPAGRPSDVEEFCDAQFAGSSLGAPNLPRS